jgi:hypothetical protein
MAWARGGVIALKSMWESTALIVSDRPAGADEMIVLRGLNVSNPPRISAGALVKTRVRSSPPVRWEQVDGKKKKTKLAPRKLGEGGRVKPLRNLW